MTPLSDEKTILLDKYCKGCIFKRKDLYCAVLVCNGIEDCPCIECLVKTMCRDKDKCQIRIRYIFDDLQTKGILKRAYS